jgi:hypothetical protein
MKQDLLSRKYGETLISGVVSLLLMAGILALLVISGILFSSDMDGRIEWTARRSFSGNTYFEGDDIQVRSREGTVLLTGTVTETSHSFSAERTVARLPGVRKVENYLEAKAKTPGKRYYAWMRQK